MCWWAVGGRVTVWLEDGDVVDVYGYGKERVTLRLAYAAGEIARAVDVCVHGKRGVYGCAYMLSLIHI